MKNVNSSVIQYFYEKEFHSILTSLSFDENNYFNDGKFYNSNFTVDSLGFFCECFLGSGEYDNSRYS
jgi:hypothetical protein